MSRTHNTDPYDVQARRSRRGVDEWHHCADGGGCDIDLHRPEGLAWCVAVAALGTHHQEIHRIRAYQHADDEQQQAAHRAAACHSRSSTGVPGPTEAATRSALQLVRRMQPCDWVLPMVEGTGVPWMP